MRTTTKLGIQVPQAADAPDLPTHLGYIADAADKLAPVDQGTLALRPVSTIASPGIIGRFYRVTGDPDTTQNGRVWFDTGTSWAEVGNVDALLKTLIDAKGDLIVGTADNTPARVGVGADGQVLTADSTNAAGLKWSAAAGGGVGKGTAFPTVPAPAEGDLFIRTDQPGDPMYKYVAGTWEQQPRMGAQTIPSARVGRTASSGALGDGTGPGWTTEDWDTNSLHDPVTNNDRLTVSTPGTYSVSAAIIYDADTTGTFRGAELHHYDSTGTLKSVEGVRSPVVANARINPSATFRAAAGDYFTVVLRHDATGGRVVTYVSATEYPFFEATWLGGAGQTVDERGVPAVRGVASGTVVPTGAWTALTFDSEAYDTDSMHDPTTNATRITFKTPGIYSLAGFVADDTIGLQTIAHIRVNGTTYIAPSYLAGPAASFTGNRPVVAQYQFAAGDYVELVAQQTSGANHTINGALAAVLVGSGKTVTPFARVKRATSQVINSGANAFITFDAEDADNDGMHDTVTNADRVTANTAGTFLIVCEVGADSIIAASGTQVVLEKNTVGAAPTGGASVINSGPMVGFFGLVVGVAELAAGDWVRAWMGNRAGFNVDVNGSSLMLVKIGAPNTGNTGIEVVETPHAVGGAGEPAFQNAWSNQTGEQGLSFYKDRGRVYLRGFAQSGTAAAVFVLPVGYRPPFRIRTYAWAVVGGTAQQQQVNVEPDGTVEYANAPIGAGNYVSFDNVQFRV